MGGIAGLRASEITSLKWGDLDLDGGALVVRNGKGGKTRRVPLSASLIADLRELGQQKSQRRRRPMCRTLWAPFLTTSTAAFDGSPGALPGGPSGARMDPCGFRESAGCR